MKKLYAILLVLAMTLGMIPGSAAAEEATKFSAASLKEGAKVLYAKFSDGMAEDGKLTEGAWQTNVSLSGGVKFGAVWDREYLYLGFTGTAAPTAITLNGVAVTRAGKVSAGTREICIPLQEAGITLVDYDVSTKLTVSLGGAKWDGTLVFDSVESKSINKFTASRTETSATSTYDSEKDTLHFVGAGDSVVLVRQTAYTDAATTSSLAEPLKIIDPAKNPVAFEFDCRIDKLGVYRRHYVSTTQKESCYGLYFIVGGKLDNADGTLADTDSAGMSFGITNVEEGLVLSVRATDFADGEAYETAAKAPLSIALDKEMGQQFHLRMNYDAANDTIDVFVDDVFKGHIEGAEFDNPFRFSKSDYVAHLQVGAYSHSRGVVGGDNAFDISVSNLTIGAQRELDPATSLAELSFSAIKGGNGSASTVYSDLNLIASIPGPLQIPLTWTSSNPEVVDVDGKVGKVTEDTAVTLTAALTDDPTQTKSFKVTVKGLEAAYPSPTRAEASFAKPAVTMDGALKEVGWRMGGRILGRNNLPTAEYGFQWNQTHLFAAIDFLGPVAPAELTFNGHTFTIENGKLLENGAEVAGAVVVVGADAVELSVPFGAIGMGDKISQYDVSMPVRVAVNGVAGPVNTLTLVDIAWFSAVNRHNSPAYSATSQVKVAGNNPVAGYQGFTKLENGWRLYDLFNPNGDNPAGIRTYALYQDPGFDNRAVGTRIEFDFRADAMPYGVWDEGLLLISAHSNFGFTFAFGTKYDANQYAQSVVCGIVNTPEGLVFAMRNDTGHKIDLDKQVGETFNLAVDWNRDDTLDIYVDGVLKGTMTSASMYKKGASNQSVVFNLLRNPKADGAIEPEDSYDVTINNLSYGHIYDEDNLLSRISFADIAGSNPDADHITSNLTMTGTITDGLLDNVYPITWTSSDESVISNTGVVTRPQTGAAFVTLTATSADGSKSFDVVVQGKIMDNSKVLRLESDLNPAAGAGQPYDELLFTFDTNNNSIIAVKDKAEKINRVTLTDGDDKARLNAESLTLWVSDDNAHYTQIRNFKLIQHEEKWYLYDFETTGKYIKVHYTQYRGEDASFIGALGTMITAEYDPSLAKGKTTEYTLTNTTNLKYDVALTIPGLTGNLSGIRVFAPNGNLMYHYVEGDAVIVRVPEIAPGTSLRVYVQQAAAGALELANKESVYEITYGSREVMVNASSTRFERWVMALPAGTKFANGTTLEQDTLYGMGGSLNVSTDGGRTWKAQSKVIKTAPEGKTPVEHLGGGGGWIFDSHTGRMFFHPYWIYTKLNPIDITLSNCEQMIIASDDGGKSWYLVDTIERDVVNDPQSAYMLTYSDGLELSVYDGKGPNVDFVFPVGSQHNNVGGFCVRVIYSRDGGESWQLSESKIVYDAATAGTSEDGCSEAFIQERDDGVLVLYTRCQYAQLDNFGVSYSLDHGVTWQENVSLSKMYTTNTQAMIRDITVNGSAADLSIWGGNAILGCRSYSRNPLNVAVSTNGSDTYRNIQNLFFKSEMELYRVDCHTVTNPSLAKVNDTDMFISFQDRGDSKAYINMFVQDFDKWFTRTRGGYDNFEHGTTQYEGWVSMYGGTELSTVNARDKYSMRILPDTVVTRSVPYLQNGAITMELYAPANASFTMELQCAFSPTYGDVAMPIGLRAENGKLYMNNSGKVIGELKAGWNTLTFDLELTKDVATLSVNGGAPTALEVLTRAGDYVCYITFGTESEIWVDEVLITSELEPVMDSTSADKAAADAVIEQINALAAMPAARRVEKVAEVRAAYDALTQVQQDLIDRNVVGDPNAPVERAMVNPYQVLMSYAGPVTFKDVKVGDWYYDAVSYATSNGIMSGYNAEKFGPNDTLNRAMVVQVLYNKEGQPALNGLKHNFSDVPANQWFNNAVTWGSNRGVVSGYGGGVFKPEDAVTIEQVAVILWNYSNTPTGSGDLSQVGNHSDWAANALKWAVEKGILNNVPFTNATEKATRAQTAQMLINYLRGN